MSDIVNGHHHGIYSFEIVAVDICGNCTQRYRWECCWCRYRRRSWMQQAVCSGQVWLLYGPSLTAQSASVCNCLIEIDQVPRDRISYGIKPVGCVFSILYTHEVECNGWVEVGEEFTSVGAFNPTTSCLPVSVIMGSHVHNSASKQTWWVMCFLLYRHFQAE